MKLSHLEGLLKEDGHFLQHVEGFDFIKDMLAEIRQYQKRPFATMDFL
jgi:hypothetical protein